MGLKLHTKLIKPCVYGHAQVDSPDGRGKSFLLNCHHNDGSTEFSKMSLYAVALLLTLHFSGASWPCTAMCLMVVICVAESPELNN